MVTYCNLVDFAQAIPVLFRLKETLYFAKQDRRQESDACVVSMQAKNRMQGPIVAGFYIRNILQHVFELLRPCCLYCCVLRVS